MKGMERMMKSFGIDPDKILETFRSQMEEVVQQVRAEFDMLHDRMKALEEAQERMERKIDSIESGLLHNLNNYMPTDALEKLTEDLTIPDPPDGARVIPISPQGSFDTDSNGVITNIRSKTDAA